VVSDLKILNLLECGDLADLLLAQEALFEGYYWVGLMTCTVEQLPVTLLSEEEAGAAARQAGHVLVSLGQQVSGLEQQDLLDDSLVGFDLAGVDASTEKVWAVAVGNYQDGEEHAAVDVSAAADNILAVAVVEEGGVQNFVAVWKAVTLLGFAAESQELCCHADLELVVGQLKPDDQADLELAGGLLEPDEQADQADLELVGD